MSNVNVRNNKEIQPGMGSVRVWQSRGGQFRERATISQKATGHARQPETTSPLSEKSKKHINDY